MIKNVINTTFENNGCKGRKDNFFGKKDKGCQ